MDEYVERQIRVYSYMNSHSVDTKNMTQTQVSIDSSQFNHWRCDIPQPPPSSTPPQDHHHNTSSAGGGAGNRSRVTQTQPNFVKQLEMTFNLKDFKAFLQFCEHAHQPVTIFLDHQGKPIIFESNAANHQNDMEAVCVLATLHGDASSQSTQSTMTPPSSSHHSTYNATPTPSPARRSHRNTTTGRSSVSTFVSTPLQDEQDEEQTSGNMMMSPPPPREATTTMTSTTTTIKAERTTTTTRTSVTSMTPNDDGYHQETSTPNEEVYFGHLGSAEHKVVCESPLSSYGGTKRSHIGMGSDAEEEDEDDDQVIEDENGHRTPKRTRY